MKNIKRKIIKRINRAKSIAKEYKNNEDKLSTHGFWSFGYWIGRMSAFEDCLGYLDEDYCDDNIRFEPEGNIIENHTDENGIAIVDKFEITGISAYCERKRKEKEAND